MVLRKILMVLWAVVTVHLSGAAPVSAMNVGFKQWLDDFYPTAAKEGISRATWDSAFTGVTEPDPQVLEKASFQTARQLRRSDLFIAPCRQREPSSRGAACL